MYIDNVNLTTDFYKERDMKQANKTCKNDNIDAVAKLQSTCYQNVHASDQSNNTVSHNSAELVYSNIWTSTDWIYEHCVTDLLFERSKALKLKN